MKKYYLYSLIISIVSIFIHCGPGEQPVTLVSPTQYCTIVTDLGKYSSAEAANFSAHELDWNDTENPDNIASVHAHAALELRNYLAKLLVLEPAELPIVDDDATISGPVIFVGTPKSTGKWETLSKKLKKRWKRSKSKYNNGFRLDTFYFKEAPDYMVLSGENAHATLYAVYEFLNKLGIRWVSPDETGEIVPTQGGLVLQPMAIFKAPPLKFRGFLYDYIGPVPRNQAVTPEFLTWMARNRLNLIKANDSLQYMYGQLGIESCNGDEQMNQLALNPFADYPYTDGAKGKADPYPKSPNARDMDNNGQLSYLEAHPEWYHIQDKNDGPLNPVLCVHQDDLLKEMADQIAKRWNNIDYITIYNIQSLPWCNCSACASLGNDTDKLLTLLYKLNKLLKENSNLEIIGLTDAYTLKPPSNPLPEDYDYENIHLFFSPHKRCYNHGLDDPICADVNAHYLAELNKWKARNSYYTGDLNVCELYHNRHFQNLPVIFTRVMHQDILALNELGINGLCIQNPLTSHSGVQYLMNYQFSRSTWRSNVDMDSLKIEFIVNQYPGAYQLMQEYYSKVEEAMASISAWKWEMPERVNHVVLDSSISSLLPLGDFANHFVLEENTTDPQNGTHWERTYQLIYEVQYILYEALTGDIPPQTKRRLMDLNEHKKYSELLINLYDNILRVLTLDQNEPEMKIEALIRLEDIAKELEPFVVKEPAFGIVSGMQASEIYTAVQKILRENQRIIAQYKTQ